MPIQAVYLHASLTDKPMALAILPPLLHDVYDN
jgi:hypothetical protein